MKRIIEQIFIDDSLTYEQQIERIEELSHSDNTYILFNSYNTACRMWERTDRNIPETWKPADFWRLRLFKDYYKRNYDRPLFYESLVMSINAGQISIITIK